MGDSEPVTGWDTSGAIEIRVEADDFRTESGEGICEEVVESEFSDSDDSSYVHGDDDSNSDGDSDTPSWMFEDLEGPEDDDIFVDKPEDHGRIIYKMARKFMREKRKKRAEERVAEQVAMLRENEDWCSDVELDDAVKLDASDEWDDSTDMRNFELSVGLKFPNREKFRDVLKDWAVRKGLDLIYPKCEKKVITAKCKSGCDWALRASTIQHSTTFQIKTMKGSHTCAWRKKNTQADYKYIGRRILDTVRDNPDESLDGLKNKIRRECGLECSMHKVFKAKKYALSLLSVDVGLQYSKLYDYCLTVEHHNPGSSLVVKVNGEVSPPKFRRMYVCLAPMKNAFLSGCRPIIGLDGCFLKGLHAGQLLSAVGRDGNDNMLPIAIAYVEVEKQETWEWFLDLLFKDIGAPTDRDWAFISDRQKGLIEAVNKLAPNSEHRFCVRHMYNNFKTKFGSLELKRLFWKAALTYSVSHHHRIMKEIERLSPKRGDEQTAYGWLSNVPSKHWARCFFPPNTKCDVIVNNLSESFNSYIMPSRDLPIIDMFEWIRKKCTTRLQIKREGMKKYNEVVCPSIIKKIEAQRNFSRNCFADWAGEDRYEVMHGLNNYIVHLKEGHCLCGMFQLCGFPCCHAIACISLHRLDVTEYVDNYFKKEVYLRVYSHMINPIPGMHDYKDSGKGPIGPPDVRMKRGRPKKRRRPDGNDRIPQVKASRKGLTTTCRKCGKTGHNKRTCNDNSEVLSQEQNPEVHGDGQSSILKTLGSQSDPNAAKYKKRN